MKWFLFIAGILPSLISLVSCSVAPEDKSEKILTDTKISVMSFNIRLDGDTASHSWDYRKNGCLAMIGSVKPDLIGMQEVTPVQKNWLENQFDKKYIDLLGNKSNVYPEKILHLHQYLY